MNYSYFQLVKSSINLNRMNFFLMFAAFIVFLSHRMFFFSQSIQHFIEKERGKRTQSNIIFLKNKFYNNIKDINKPCSISKTNTDTFDQYFLKSRVEFNVRPTPVDLYSVQAQRSN